MVLVQFAPFTVKRFVFGLFNFRNTSCATFTLQGAKNRKRKEKTHKAIKQNTF